MEDQKIVKLIQLGKQDKAFLKLYKSYPKVHKLIISKGGSNEDAKDIFQEALIIFYEKARQKDFQLTAAISTYLYSVCRFLWKDQLVKKKGNPTAEFSSNLSSADETELQEVLKKEEQFIKMETVLNQIGEKCLELLQLFYYKGLRMKEIASKLGLKSEKIAKNQKYKCLERAKQKVQSI
jgi:RNA polymerase sigma factor (sigma-70 family)